MNWAFRDVYKRQLADLTVVTSDNPRDEEPMDIINDILQGVHKADGEYEMCIRDRSLRRMLLSTDLHLESWMMLQIFHFPRLSPVSYTHLDVYKRQDYEYA